LREKSTLLAKDMTLKFISKAERERLREAQESARIEQQKSIEEQNKLKRRELLKMATTTSTVEALPKPIVNVVSVPRGQPQFGWDDAEDTWADADYLAKPRSSVQLLETNKKIAPVSSWTSKLTSEMTERDWKIFREDHHISIAGKRQAGIPHPFRNWSESGLPRDLLDAVFKAGYTKPSPIQMQAIPIALAERDIVGLSATGSGKTAAFILPMLTYIKALPRITSTTTALDGPYSLVLAPSRELAIQIEAEAVKFSSFCNIKSTCIVGGRSADQQTLTLSQGVELIVATPGRLVDSIDAKQTALNQCFYVVLDEADKMIDLGFESFVNQILDAIPASNLKPVEEDEQVMAQPGQYRITQMFSATMPASVAKLTAKYLRNPVTISVGDVGSGGAKPEIEQRVEVLYSDSDKKKKLLEIIHPRDEFPMMVFVNSKRQADFVGNVLDNIGVRTVVLHSGKTQDKREHAIAQFKEGKCEVLVSTDVAGRGIDVPNVKHVINFDMPRSIEDYTHRIGRTARTAGSTGIATSFVILQSDDAIIPALKKYLNQSKQFVPPELERASFREETQKRKRGEVFDSDMLD
jgi:ATP-dependent RNA helicase DDX23/PRP28